jgi:hypothetical protein
MYDEHWQVPIIQHLVDTVLDQHVTTIIFPGWNKHPKLNIYCAHKFQSREHLSIETVHEMAKKMHCKLEIEEGDHLDTFDYSGEDDGVRSDE